MQFEAVKNEAGLNRFVMTPTKWITQMNAIGIVSKAGRYGGTYAHSDMVMSLNWNLNRETSKLNYRIHTDAIIDSSKQTIGLYPKEKIGFDSIVSICPVDRINIMVTDWDAAEEDLKFFDEKGMEIVVVEKDDSDVDSE